VLGCFIENNIKDHKMYKRVTPREQATKLLQALARLSCLPRSPLAKEAIIESMNQPLIDFTRSEYGRGLEEGLRIGMARVATDFNEYDVIVTATVKVFCDGEVLGELKFASTLQEVAFAIRATTPDLLKNGGTMKVTDLSVSVDGVETTPGMKKKTKDVLTRLANWTSAKHGAYAKSIQDLAEGITTSFFRIHKNVEMTENSHFIPEVYEFLVDKKESGEPLNAVEKELFKIYNRRIEKHINAETPTLKM
jgi:hypothetical protein